jgi:drug/metabolite transporter (DMT)-like permease
MNWLLPTLGCAFFTATAAACSKLLLKKSNLIFVGWVRLLVSTPILIALLFILRPGLQFQPGFWKIVIILLPFELGAFLIYLKALEISPLSLTFPFLGFTPIFSIFFSRIFLQERSSNSGIIGIALISLGAYLLNADSIKKGIFEPLKNIYREKGSLFMLCVAFIYGFTSVLGKKAVLLAPSPFSYVIVYYVTFFVVFTPFMFAGPGISGMGLKKKDLFAILILGVSFTAAMLLHFNAIILEKVPYVISVKRLSLVISVLYGALIFKERHIGCRLLGSFIMLGGVLILSLLG